MPQLERFLNIWKFIYSYVQDIESSVSSSICAICDSLMLCTVHYFGKRWFFMKYFNWCMPQLERFFIIWQFFLSICARYEAFGFFDCFLRYLLLSYALYGTLFGKRWFLNIWTVFYSYVQDIDFGTFNFFFAICDSLMLCKVHYFGKRYFFHEIFLVDACLNLKDSLIYENFSNHLTKHRKFGIFNFYALSVTPYCFARYIILEKDDFSWIFSSWCMPQLERFLIIW